MSNTSPSVVSRPGEGRKYWVVGDLVDIKVSGKETNGDYAVIETTVLPGGGPPLHSHQREHESFYTLEGEVEFTVDGTVVTARPGTALHAPKGSRHRFANNTSQPAKMLIYLCPAGFEEYFIEVGTPVTDPDSLPPEPDIEKLIQAAAKFGLEFHL